MDTDGAYDGQATRAGQVPRPAGAPAGAPPMPTRPPGVRGVEAALAGSGGAGLSGWLRTPRSLTAPGVWGFGHVPRDDEAPEAASDRTLLSGALISLLACVLVWTLMRNGYIPYWDLPIRLFTPDHWWVPPVTGEPVKGTGGEVAQPLYELAFDAALLYGFGRLGAWVTAWRRLILARGRLAHVASVAVVCLVALALVNEMALPVTLAVYPFLPLPPHDQAGNTATMQRADMFLNVLIILTFVWAAVRRPRSGFGRAVAAGEPGEQGHPSPPDADADSDPVAWAEVREAGLGDVADRLRGEVVGGRMNDVDYVRIRRAWESVRVEPSRRQAFAEAVRDKGAAACVHPSGARDLPARAARHDLLARQVLLGTVEDGERNPYARRGTSLALDPGVLGTSLLAVGPSGSGKTSRLVRPVVESLALQALAGQVAVVAVGAAGARLGPDAAYDVVVRVGDPASLYDLDLYGGAVDPDEAATLLAEAFVGDVPGVDVRRSATALAQLLGPFHAAHGRFPAVPELRELLDGLPPALAALRRALEDADGAGRHAMLRELDARTRQHGAHGDPGPALADRLALLDRPAFAGFFDTGGQGRPFSMRALEHPIRVRVDLPERGHADASRMLSRLLLAQFNAAAAARGDRSLFAFLALDDASHTLTPETVRGVQRLRSANAGVLLTLRTLDDVPEGLRTPLLGAVGCRMAFSGVTTWDGKRFAEAWGTEWVETRDVTHRTVFADQPLTRAIHAFRKLVTGKAVTTDAVTVRQVERERWSASDLAHAVPPGCAVLSLTSVRGERAAPLLLRLAGKG
ncbi:ATP/GTP-binding protein [Streptomyces sp. NPDC090054]|uniref:ATP/GTP-binding protein n=1 Tax=Streptomyces sp. NPDC090054 TaxID=3365933 RepID=UPI003818ACA4